MMIIIIIIIFSDLLPYTGRGREDYSIFMLLSLSLVIRVMLLPVSFNLIFFFILASWQEEDST